MSNNWSLTDQLQAFTQCGSALDDLHELVSHSLVENPNLESNKNEPTEGMIMEGNNCMICNRCLFLPICYDLCHHVFCLACVWNHLITVSSSCLVCGCWLIRFRHVDGGVGGIGGKGHTSEEQSSIYLQILYYILQEHDGAMVNYNLNDKLVRAVYDPNFVIPGSGNNEPGIPQHVLDSLGEIRESYLALENEKGDEYADPHSEEHSVIHLLWIVEPERM